MIAFDLRCASGGHVFEGWFGSSAAYEEQRAAGLVACPLCGCGEIGKAPMAPAVAAKGNARPGSGPPPSDLAAAAPDEAKEMLAAAAALQRSLLAGSEAVGDRFAEEARSIHLGEAAGRPIHGRATRAEAEALHAEGVAIAPLPFPVRDPGEEN